MINKIGIENFRVFKEYTEFELAPITLLTGPNNSGKSSFIKLLSLLQHSFDSPTGLNILNFDGGNHNLGTFKKVLHWDNKSNHFKITFDLPLDYFDEKFKLELTYAAFEENGKLFSFKIYNQKRVLIDVFQPNTIYENEFEMNSSKAFKDYYKLDLYYIKDTLLKNKKINETQGLLFNYFLKSDKNKNEQTLNKRFFEIFKQFEKEYGSNFFYYDYENIGDWKLLTRTLNVLPFFDTNFSNYFKKIIQNHDFPSYTKEEMLFFFKITENIEIKLNVELKDIFEKYLQENIHQGFEKIIYSISNINHLSVTRGSKNRILTNKSNNEIDEIVKKFYHKKEGEDFIKKCFKLLGIDGELIIERNQGVSSTVYIEQGKNKTILSDLGFGYSQIIPILLKISLLSKVDMFSDEDNPYLNKLLKSDNKKSLLEGQDKIKSLEELILKIHALHYKTSCKILIIEEPEANLHPNLQSKLADILVLAYQTFDILFILETHSEYLIRKLQYLTGKGEIHVDDTRIYYFNSDEYVSDKENKVKEIRITKSGGLTDTFGPGFFDEATRLQFELLRLNQEQNN